PRCIHRRLPKHMQSGVPPIVRQRGRSGCWRGSCQLRTPTAAEIRWTHYSSSGISCASTARRLCSFQMAAGSPPPYRRTAGGTICLGEVRKNLLRRGPPSRQRRRNSGCFLGKRLSPQIDRDGNASAGTLMGQYCMTDVTREEHEKPHRRIYAEGVWKLR